LKEISSALPTKERWIQIAAKIKGKSPKECYTRFRELCNKGKGKTA